MNDQEIMDVVREAIGEVAPEADLEAIDPAESVQEQLDIDSLDFLNVVIGIHERTGVEIPERDYPKMATLDGCVAYLRDAAGRAAVS